MKKKQILIIFLVCMVILLATIIGCAKFGIGAGENSDRGATANIDFTDVQPTDWFYEDVKYVCENGWMNGTGEQQFSPSATTTRGMIVTILWRLEGEPKGKGSTFNDVSADAYYADSVAWAVKERIVNGYDDTHFAPENTATREQLATILFRYAAYKKYDVTARASFDAYSDKKQISPYAEEALSWANAMGLITGIKENILAPGDDLQRSQLAAILKRFSLKFMPQQGSSEYSLATNAPSSTDRPSSGGNSSGGLDRLPEDLRKMPSLEVESVQAKPGEDVTVTVNLRNNPGILGMAFHLYYDDNVCVLQSARSGEAVADILEFTTSKTTGSGMRFLWDGIELSESDVHDGAVLILHFEIRDDAKVGNYPISIKYFDGDIVDNDLNNVSPTTKDGAITIIK